jgi:hypothetical protein
VHEYSEEQVASGVLVLGGKILTDGVSERITVKTNKDGLLGGLEGAMLAS